MRRSLVSLTALCVCVSVGGINPQIAAARVVGWVAHVFQPPTPLTSVAAVGARRAWTVGPGGVILATSDGGASWARQSSPTADDLYDVAFTDGSHGWVVGASGTVLGTGDGGLNWTLQSTPATEALFGAAAHGVLAWFAGAGGTILTTADDGAHWAIQTAAAHDLYSVTMAADGRHGWAVGDVGTILATYDGGRTWSAQPASTHAYLNGVACWGARDAWAVGQNGIIIATTNGGARWSVARPSRNGAPDLYTVAFADRRHGWAVGVGGLLLATVDGGAHWRAQQCPFRQDLTGVAFGDVHHGLIASSGAVLVTSSGGWVDLRPPVTVALGAGGWHNRVVRVVLRASDGVGGSGIDRVQYSRDGGRTWKNGSAVIVPAPATHRDDGSHLIRYRAIDNAGNVEVARTCSVGVDTRPLVPEAPWALAVRQGGVATLKFVIADRLPGCPTAAVTIRICSEDGRLVRMLRLTVRVDRTVAYRFRCRLPAGSYRFFIDARDSAGNRQAVVASNRLVVVT